MPKTTKTPPRDLLTLRATDGRRVQVQARQIRAVTPAPPAPVTPTSSHG